MRHAAIPINVDTGEHARGNRPTEGFDVWSGRPPPGIYASSWQAAFEQAMALALRPRALQRLQDELIAFRRRMLSCVRTDAQLLFERRPAEVSKPGQRSGVCGRSG